MFNRAKAFRDIAYNIAVASVSTGALKEIWWALWGENAFRFHERNMVKNVKEIWWNIWNEYGEMWGGKCI